VAQQSEEATGKMSHLKQNVTLRQARQMLVFM